VGKGSRKIGPGKINGCGMVVRITKPTQTYIQSNAEPKPKPVVVVVWRGRDARRQKWRLGGRVVDSIFIGRPSEY
jgi:hypothetical protein